MSVQLPDRVRNEFLGCRHAREMVRASRNRLHFPRSHLTNRGLWSPKPFQAPPPLWKLSVSVLFPVLVEEAGPPIWVPAARLY